MGIAQELFDAELTVNRLEDKIGEALEKVGISCEDFTYDHYDVSIEIYLYPAQAEPTREQLLKIKELGFGKVYWHPDVSNGRRGSDNPDCKLYSLRNLDEHKD